MGGRERRYRVRNATRSIDLATRAERADTVLRRGIGLMGRSDLEQGAGLVIEPCNGIVMFFMRFALDVLFVDRDGQIVHALHGIRPWRVSRVVLASRYVVELPAGTLRQTGTEVGDRIEVTPTQAD